ncbi:MAG: metallophosphoesterase [Clostridia bacterium]|nr:metallophosphoesterase [Clostridia bacterium]
MKRIIAVAVALIIAVFAAMPAFSADSGAPEFFENERNIPNVMVADEFRTADTAEYPDAAGEKLLTIDLVSDTHIGSGSSSSYLRAGISTINAEKNEIDSVFVSGDLTDSGYDSEFSECYSILKNYTGENMITVNGNHDYGRWSQSGAMRPYAIKHRNEFMGISTQKDYYSTEINGYKVVVMGSEGNKPNSADISDEQLEFVREEVREGAQGGRPVFVLCHWPMRNTHCERISWPIIPGGALDTSTTRKLQNILGAYDNVFYISGHLHAGLNGRLTRLLFRGCCVEQHNGITCINVPSLGKGNHLGYTAKGTGMRLTVYSDKAVVEGRNFYTGEWLDNYVYEVSLKNAQAAVNFEDMPAMLPETPVLPGDEEAA